MTLALQGGKAIRHEPWPKWPQGSPRIVDDLTRVASSSRWTVRGWWTGSPTFDEAFSLAFAQHLAVPYCVVTTSGTAALQVALEALDIGFGDEVILPALTWIAPAVAVVNVNAVPVFVDVSRETGCLSPEAVRAALTTKTRCILVVHPYCSLVDMDSISNIARCYGLKVLEDASQAHGARWQDRSAGTIGDVGVFSMNQEKCLPSGEGGRRRHRRPATLSTYGTIAR